MLVQFVVKNFTCFKEETKLSMVASNYDKTRGDDNVIEVPKFNLSLLRSAVIYGANASGKSKLLKAMDFMRDMVRSSSKDKQIDDPIEITPFLLNETTENAPSLFEMIFIQENIMYRYGFEVTKKEVVSEWLYRRKATKEAEIFYREYQDFEINPSNFKKGKILADNQMIKKNTLLLSAAAQFDDAIAKNVLDWFKHFNILSGLQDNQYAGFSASMLNEKQLKSEVMQFINGADLNIADLKLVEIGIDELPQELPQKLRDSIVKSIKEGKGTIFSDVSVIHKKYNANNSFSGVVEFSLDDDESSGTQKYFAFSAPLIATLQNGQLTAIDELDAKLHPNLVCKIVGLFNSKATNPKNAQLIFNTHDTNLLASGLFRRDQIWFTEKDRYGAATLYALSDFKKGNGDKARNNEDYEINYIQGRYGAIPYLGDFDKLFRTQKEEVAHENEK